MYEMFPFENEGSPIGSNEEVQKEEKKMGAPDRITVSFSKGAAELIAEFLEKTGNDNNRSKFIENLLLKEIAAYEEKKVAKDRIFDFATKNNAIFSFGLNEQGYMDVKECQYEEGYSDDAHWETITFEEIAGGTHFSRSERIEILEELLKISTWTTEDGEVHYMSTDDLPF